MDIPHLHLSCDRLAHFGTHACFRTKYLSMKLMRLRFVLLWTLTLLLLSARSKKEATFSMVGRRLVAQLRPNISILARIRASCPRVTAPQKRKQFA